MLNHHRISTDARNTNVASGSLQPIAIVGIGCRFPGNAIGPRRFWNNLLSGVDAVTDVPTDRWNAQQFYDPVKNQPGKTHSRRGGFVDGLDQFDPQFFGISPREAAHMDPQQRMLLEVTWEAMEDAGVPADQIAGSRTSVYVGISSWDFAYQGRSDEDRGVITAYTNTGVSLSVASNRISYCFDLRGPSASVDTACSSALVALHLACQSIWNDRCPMALAGGVNALLMPDSFIAFSQMGMLSPDGKCKSFDARANGFVRGEGAGMILLRPLAQAMANGDRIYAVIRGTAVNQDGRTPGMTVPRQESQELLLRNACDCAGVAPNMIQYVEAHGTGTLVGDPIETRALGSVLCADRPTDQPCIIGSVKTNIGHLEAGAGIASVIKVALALHHHQIPRNLHFEQPNPKIDFAALKLRVPVTSEPWPERDGLRLAGINGFGYGGTNAHVVLQGLDMESHGMGSHDMEAAPSPLPAQPVAALADSSQSRPQPRASAVLRPQEPASTEPASTEPATQLFPLSARCPDALRDAARDMQQFIDATAADVSLRELAGHAAHRRSHHDHRLAVVAESKQHLSDQLALFAQNQSAPDTISNRCSAGTSRQLTFVCSGQGPQWWAMGRQLLETDPTFREIIERCDRISRQLGSWSLMDELQADESVSRMHATAIAQPAIFALQVALGEMWRRWGVVPTQLVGHSVGEVAAAHMAGIYSLEDAFRIVFHRGRCMDLASSQGRMLAVGLDYEEAQQLLVPFGDEVAIAAVNSPTALTLAGTAEPLQEIAALLQQRQVFCRELKVEYAFHSQLMDPVREELLKSLSDLRPAPALIPLMSTVTGDWVDGPELGAEYWWLNVRKTVRFADAITRIANTGSDVVVELSPHPVLAYSVTECFQQAGKQVHVLSSLKRETPELPNMLRSLGQLQTIGHPIDWSQVAPKPRRFLQTPTYPWQRQKCWSESADSRRTRLAAPVHPLLGVSQGGPHPSWQSRLDVNHFTYLADHRVQGMTIFPASGYAEMALAVASVVSGKQACRIRKLTFANPCILSTEEAHWLEIDYQADDRCLHIHSRLADKDGNWTLHATAEHATYVDLPTADTFSWDDIARRCPDYFDRQSCYDFIAELGLDYGPAFRAIVEGWRRDGEAIAVVEISDDVANQQDGYLIHPALLDACFHVTIPAHDDFATQHGHLHLPIEIGQLTLHRRAGARVICHTRLSRKTSERLVADLDIYDEQSHLLLEVRGLISQRIHGARNEETVDDLFYNYMWQTNSPQTESLEITSCNQETDDVALQHHSARRDCRHWLVFADGTGMGEALIARLKADGDQVTTVLRGDRSEHNATDCYRIIPGDRDDMFQLIRAVAADSGSDCLGIVHLWNLDAPPALDLQTEGLEAAQEAGTLSVLHLVQAWDAGGGDPSANLFLVTRGAQSVGSLPELVAIAQSPVIGLGRVIISEHPGLRCKLIDVDPSAGSNDPSQLVDELRACDDEDEVALRHAERLVHRFVPVAGRKQKVPAQRSELPYRLEISRGHTLDELALRTSCRRMPEPGEVEIEIAAAALNFSDVMKVLGLYPGLPDGAISLGAECAGVITRTGDGVTEFAPGDEVIAVAPFAFGSHALVDSQLVAAKPSHLSFEEATTIPIAFLTATYALEQLARIRPGERVLIHSASGGVGLAALQCVRQAGAEVLATAGTTEKREFLRQQGIEHVMDSRSLAFADQVRQATGGQGVDVILNSLAGEAIPRGIEALATGGRFLEIGKRDIYQNARLGLLPFRNNLAFFAIDLDQLMRERPDRVGKLLRELTKAFADSQLSPLPHRTFAIGDIQDAFRFMQQGKHIGKIVVSMQDRPANLEWGECEGITFAADATYLITGGLGGFGLALAQWLVDHGARNLALMGRRGVHTAEARRAIESLEAAGATVKVLQADVSNRSDVARALDTIQHSLPPLRGLFHAAMVLEDGLLLNLNRSQMRRVMAPKMNGAWNLHGMTKDIALDHFVLFSSLSSSFGNAGQGNYAAANAMLDALAHHRRAQGAPCLTVNWGFLRDVGYLSGRQQLGERLERQGVMSFTIAQALDALERAIQRQDVQVGVMRVDWSRWRGLGVTDRVSPRFAHLLPNKSSSEMENGEDLPSIDDLHNAAQEIRPQLVGRLLRDKMARLLGVMPEHLDGDKPLLDLGLDSLMAVEMRNWIESQLNVDLPVAQLVRSAGLDRLIDTVCEQFAVSAAPTPCDTAGQSTTATDPSSTHPEQQLANIDQLSDGEVDELLTTLLQDDGAK